MRDKATHPGEDRRRAAKPLDPAKLEELALAYAARFATTAARLSAYLGRKLRERGWHGEDDPETLIETLVARFVAAGYVDDAAFARARSAALLGRGYGGRRIEQALRHAGVGDQERGAVRAGEEAARLAALRFAERRGFGPFGQRGRPDRLMREKQIAAMLRAGHPLDSARELIDAASESAAREWAGELAGEDGA